MIGGILVSFLLDPVQILANSYFFGGVGWVGLGGVENYRIRLNSAQFQLKLPTFTTLLKVLRDFSQLL